MMNGGWPRPKGRTRKLKHDPRQGAQRNRFEGRIRVRPWPKADRRHHPVFL